MAPLDWGVSLYIERFITLEERGAPPFHDVDLIPRSNRLIYGSYAFHIVEVMGIVKISENMHENLRVASDALSRSINAQAEHWMRIGMLAELHPNLDHSDICRLLIRAESAGGLDLKQLCAVADIAQGSQPHASSGASQ